MDDSAPRLELNMGDYPNLNPPTPSGEYMNSNGGMQDMKNSVQNGLVS